MDRIKQLQERKAALERQRGDIPEAIKALADEGSFVELSSFSFSEGRFFDGDGGEGVVTGFFTVAGYPQRRTAGRSKEFSTPPKKMKRPSSGCSAAAG